MMSHPKTMCFVDGENLLWRFQAMLKEGRQIQSAGEGVIYAENAFVWSPEIPIRAEGDVFRINYYTSIVGDEQAVSALEKSIGETACASRIGRTGRLIPRVHKKASNSNKTKVVDVSITMDIMRAAHTMPIDAILLLSGDGDYAPLVREVTRSTAKLMYVGALSSGLSPALTTGSEQFLNLDGFFFAS